MQGPLEKHNKNKKQSLDYPAPALFRCLLSGVLVEGTVREAWLIGLGTTTELKAARATGEACRSRSKDQEESEDSGIVAARFIRADARRSLLST